MPATDDLALLEAAARKAGQIALAHFGRAPRVWDKGGGQGPVSSADLEIDTVLRDMLCDARPGYGWLSEESPDGPARLDQERVFILDPLDGTRAFLDGADGFAHPLCLVENGRPIAAVIHMPRLGLTFTARRGHGAFCNGDPIKVSGTGLGRAATTLAPRPYMEARHWPGGTPDLARSFRPAIAWRMALVAEGKFDSMVLLKRAWHWDIAAGALLIAEAGGVVTDSQGGPLTFNTADPRSDGVIAANPALHAALVARRVG